MQKETKKHVKRLRGFTLVELILVVGTIAIVAGVLVGLISNSYEDWELGSNRSTLLQDGQAATEQMVRILRQAQAFSAVSSPNDTAGYITFTDVDGQSKEFRLDNSTNELKYGEPGDISTLTGSVSQLEFTCFDVDANSLAAPVQVRSIQSVGIETTLTDGTNSFTLSGRVFCPKDFQSVVINELMYYPDVGVQDEKHYEWVELYNLGDSAVDLDGWTIWTEKDQHDDTLIADPQFGNGSTTIPANGYAIITAEDTEVTGVDPNAVRLSINDDKIGKGLGNNTDTVAITDGSATVDSVIYFWHWGGDGDGTSLARIDPQGSSNDEDNWTSGPQNGTPGSAN